MSEREKMAIRKIAVILYQEGKITFEEQMEVFEILWEKDASLRKQELAAATV